MFLKPVLRRTTAGLLVLFAAALTPAGRCWAQTGAQQGPQSVSPAAAPTPAPAAPQAAPQAAHQAAPQAVPETGPQPAAKTALQPAPVPLVVAKTIAPVPDKAAPGPDKAGAQPGPASDQKAIPKVGPGANDAGNAATSLRTTKLSLISLIDRTVTGSEKREIGHVVDVLVDAKGEPAALVVDVGGFMGMGNRRIAIAWERFALAGRKPSDALQLPFSDAQIKAAPAFDGSEDVTVVQGAVQPPASNAALDASRVDLGEGLGTASDPFSKDPAPQADPLNPD